MTFSSIRQSWYSRSISLSIIVTFVVSMVITPRASYAQEGVLGLPQPGTMVNLSPAYVPLMITGLKVHPENPLLMDFIVSTGNSGLNADQVRNESDRLIKYFLACLTIPENHQWVNLSPYEKQRIVPEDLGQTVLGQDMLAQDYILKQLTASLIYPEKNLGKNFWDSVYAKARQMYGTTQIPVNTFNKVWILPNTANVYEHKDTVYVVKSHLKVMLDEDYLALSKHSGVIAGETKQSQVNNLGANIVRQIILPAIEQEVNTGKNFAQLRQIYNSMILAVWYKKNLRQALLNQVYTDRSKVNGIKVDDPTIKEKIYQQYLEAYKKGVFNYIKEEPADVSLRGGGADEAISKGNIIARKYFSGGEAPVDPSLLKVVDYSALAESRAAEPASDQDYLLKSRASGVASGLGDEALTVRGGLVATTASLILAASIPTANYLTHVHHVLGENGRYLFLAATIIPAIILFKVAVTDVSEADKELERQERIYQDQRDDAERQREEIEDNKPSRSDIRREKFQKTVHIYINLHQKDLQDALPETQAALNHLVETAVQYNEKASNNIILQPKGIDFIVRSALTDALLKRNSLALRKPLLDKIQAALPKNFKEQLFGIKRSDVSMTVNPAAKLQRIQTFLKQSGIIFGLISLEKMTSEQAEKIIAVMLEAQKNGALYVPEIALRGTFADKQRALALASKIREANPDAIIAAGSISNATDSRLALEAGVNIVITPGNVLGKNEIDEIRAAGSEACLGIGSLKEAEEAAAAGLTYSKAFPLRVEAAITDTDEKIEAALLKIFSGPLPAELRPYLNMVKFSKEAPADAQEGTYANIVRFVETKPTEPRVFKLPLWGMDLIEAIRKVFPGVTVTATGGATKDDIVNLRVKEGLNMAKSISSVEEAQETAMLLNSEKDIKGAKLLIERINASLGKPKNSAVPLIKKGDNFLALMNLLTGLKESVEFSLVLGGSEADDLTGLDSATDNTKKTMIGALEAKVRNLGGDESMTAEQIIAALKAGDYTLDQNNKFPNFILYVKDTRVVLKWAPKEDGKWVVQLSSSGGVFLQAVFDHEPAFHQVLAEFSPVGRIAMPSQFADIDQTTGTNGWRTSVDPAGDVTKGTFNLYTVARAAYAWAQHLKKKLAPGEKVIVGFDNRPNSDVFALIFARVLRTQGIEVVWSTKATSSPAVMRMTNPGRSEKIKYGFLVTASHNSPFDNGIKWYVDGVVMPDPEGIPVTAAIKNIKAFPEVPLSTSFDMKDGEFFDTVDSLAVSQEHYEKNFQGLAQALAAYQKKTGVWTILDQMHGSSGGFAEYLRTLGLEVIQDRTVPMSEMWKQDDFRNKRYDEPGKKEPVPFRPEPKEVFLHQRFQQFKAEAPAGSLYFAIDGDADRLAVWIKLADGKIMEVAPNDLGVLYGWMLVNDVMKQDYPVGEPTVYYIDKTQPTTTGMDFLVEYGNKLAKESGKNVQFKLRVTPVGSKNFAPEYQKGVLLIGVEESGHIVIKDFFDDAVGQLHFLLKALAASGSSLNDTIFQAKKEVGEAVNVDLNSWVYQRVNPQITPKFTSDFLGPIKAGKPEIALQHLVDALGERGKNIREVRMTTVSPNFETGDVKLLGEYEGLRAEGKAPNVKPAEGMILSFNDGSWLMVRVSGTEGLVRVYAEAPSKDDIIAMQKAVVQAFDVAIKFDTAMASNQGETADDFEAEEQDLSTEIALMFLHHELAGVIIAQEDARSRERLTVEQDLTREFERNQRRFFEPTIRESTLRVREDRALLNGGIDLNSKNLNMQSSGQKVSITFDQAMIQQFKRGDFSGVRIQILDVIPVSIMPLLGLKEDEASGQVS